MSNLSIITSDIQRIRPCDPLLGGMPQLVQIPGLSRTWQIVSNCRYFSRNRVSIALNVFYLRWVAEFGDDDRNLLLMLNDLLIEWSTKEKTMSGYTYGGDKVENARVLGLVLSPGIIWINTDNKLNVCETSLVHELIHIGLISQSYRGDPDHEGPIYPGWSAKHTALMYSINSILYDIENNLIM